MAASKPPDMRSAAVRYQTHGWRRFEWPPSLVDIARRRTEQLLYPRYLISNPISVIVQSAYLQGIADGIHSVLGDEEATPDEQR